MGLAERCLMETSFGTSTSAPPLVPSPFGQNYYQIVQTPRQVMIHSELIHDARIIRIGGTHPPSSVRFWLGRFNRPVGRRHAGGRHHEFQQSTTHFRSSGLRLHVVERFTRSSDATIDYNFTVDDPETWAVVVERRGPFPSGQRNASMKYACHEGQLLDGECAARSARRGTAGPTLADAGDAKPNSTEDCETVGRCGVSVPGCPVRDTSGYTAG
jgi:hypothetical protein